MNLQCLTVKLSTWQFSNVISYLQEREVKDLIFWNPPITARSKVRTDDIHMWWNIEDLGLIQLELTELLASVHHFEINYDF